MSNMDNGLFYKITEEETTFIVLFVDETLIFSKRQLDIDQFVVSMNRHYELTLDTKADSFLGINIGHNEDGTVTLTQPKLDYCRCCSRSTRSNSACARPERRCNPMGRSLHTTKRKDNHRPF
jgi:hypothetical protein